MVETATGVVAIKDSALTLTALIHINGYIYEELKQHKYQDGKWSTNQCCPTMRLGYHTSPPKL